MPRTGQCRANKTFQLSHGITSCHHECTGENSSGQLGALRWFSPHPGMHIHEFGIFVSNWPHDFFGVIPCDLEPWWPLAGHAEAAFQSQASTPQRGFVKQSPNQSHAVRDATRG